MNYIIWGNKTQSCNVGADVIYNVMEFRDVVDLGVLKEFNDILELDNVMELCYAVQILCHCVKNKAERLFLQTST